MSTVHIPKRDQVFLLLITLIVVNFLFFIDEGFNDFRWMKHPGNWMAFAIYFVVLFTLQIGFWVLVKKMGQNVKLPLVSVIGITTGLGFLFYWLG